MWPHVTSGGIIISPVQNLASYQRVWIILTLAEPQNNISLFSEMCLLTRPADRINITSASLCLLISAIFHLLFFKNMHETGGWKHFLSACCLVRIRCCNGGLKWVSLQFKNNWLLMLVLMRPKYECAGHKNTNPFSWRRESWAEPQNGLMVAWCNRLLWWWNIWICGGSSQFPLYVLMQQMCGVAGWSRKTARHLRLSAAASGPSRINRMWSSCSIFFSPLGFDAFKMRTLAISFMWNEL